MLCFGTKTRISVDEGMEAADLKRTLALIEIFQEDQIGINQYVAGFCSNTIVSENMVLIQRTLPYFDESGSSLNNY